LKIETSKLILFVSYVNAFVLTFIVILGTFLGFDMTNVTQITLASWAEVAVCNTFYLKKACRENIFKNLPEKYLESVDFNNLV
jgi:hypothetical protein